ncbi:glycosyltransferase family 8 protein [Ceraceosorus bombacis]|uniref:Glycosyltransferase family 8 protein n=1 Tax=Ceraceosorus bombacis TaxID=401625 RepID=A0A0P1BJQ7_9BASI|nr:glycosyltransferase family 8 protein [Ceraceosorus bombacis]
MAATIPIADSVKPSVEEYRITSYDGLTLPARRFVPRVEAFSTPKAAVILLHGFIEHHDRYQHVGNFLASQGVQTLTFSQRGYGKQEIKKNYSNTSWPRLFQDIESIVVQERKALDEKHGVGKVPLFLYGHSMGGGLAFGFFARPETEEGAPKAETKKLIKGIVVSSPWLRLTHPPPSAFFWLAPRLLKAFPNVMWYAPVNPAELSHDPAVVAENKKDPLISGVVYVRAIAGPLLGGPRLVSEWYKNYPKDLPVLFAHGEADPVTSPKASRELYEKLEASDKDYKSWPGFFHEGHNEKGDDKVHFLQYNVDWILRHAGRPDDGAEKAGPTSGAAAPVVMNSFEEEAEEKKADGKACWATLMTGEKYLPGLVVFATSLLQTHKSRYPLVVYVTGKLSERARRVVSALGCRIVEVKDLRPTLTSTNLAYERFGDVWTKLRAFELTQYERVVMVDSDMLVRRNMDELMDLQLDDGKEIASSFACTCNPKNIPTYPADWVPANCGFTPQTHPSCLTSPPQVTADSLPTHRLLNSGLVVLKPSLDTMKVIEHMLGTDPRVLAWSFPDQDLLAALLRYVHPRMWVDAEVRNVHYILDKPWQSIWQEVRSTDNATTHAWWLAAFRELDMIHGAGAGAARGAKGIIIDPQDWQDLVRDNMKIGEYQGMDDFLQTQNGSPIPSASYPSP